MPLLVAYRYCVCSVRIYLLIPILPTLPVLPVLLPHTCLQFRPPLTFLFSPHTTFFLLVATTTFWFCYPIPLLFIVIYGCSVWPSYTLFLLFVVFYFASSLFLLLHVAGCYYHFVTCCLYAPLPCIWFAVCCFLRLVWNVLFVVLHTCRLPLFLLYHCHNIFVPAVVVLRARLVLRFTRAFSGRLPATRFLYACATLRAAFFSSGSILQFFFFPIHYVTLLFFPTRHHRACLCCALPPLPFAFALCCCVCCRVPNIRLLPPHIPCLRLFNTEHYPFLPATTFAAALPLPHAIASHTRTQLVRRLPVRVLWQQFRCCCCGAVLYLRCRVDWLNTTPPRTPATRVLVDSFVATTTHTHCRARRCHPTRHRILFVDLPFTHCYVTTYHLVLVLLLLPRVALPTYIAYRTLFGVRA